LNIQEAIYANKNMSFYLWSECYGGMNDVGQCLLHCVVITHSGKIKKIMYRE